MFLCNIEISYYGYQQKVKKETLYGIHPVFEALKAKRRTFFTVYTSGDKHSKRIGDVVSFAEAQKIPILKVRPSQLKSMTDTDLHQGIAARVSSYPFANLSEIIGDPETIAENRFLLIMDNVVDPQNFGALVRTALSVGIGGMLIPKDRSAQPTPAVSKSSAGALEHVRLAKVTNIVNAIKTLKKNGLWIVGLDRTAGKSVFSGDFPDSVAIVIGSEHKGIRPLVKKHCDDLIQSDGIIIVHPNWWGQPPAILKGWIDKIIRPGIAYEFEDGDNGEGIPIGLLKAKTGIVFNTTNTSAIRENKIFKDPLETIWKNCIFDFCGVKQFERKIYRIIVTSDLKQRLQWLKETRELIDKYFPKD
jgi:23S rRNA (guanosine2251-2'-O)-methyltransferase